MDVTLRPEDVDSSFGFGSTADMTSGSKKGGGGGGGVPPGDACVYHVAHLLWQQDLLAMNHASGGAQKISTSYGDPEDSVGPPPGSTPLPNINVPYFTSDLDPDLVLEAESFPELHHWSMATRDKAIPVGFV